MSTIIEVTPIEGIDTEGTPGCTMLHPYPKRCGGDSVARVKTQCVKCSTVHISFACDFCLDCVLTGTAGCGMCINFLTGKVSNIRMLGET